MPSRNAIKEYIAGGVYHIYNRGIDKRDIFLDEKDYKMLLFFLKIYLLDRETLKAELHGSDPCRIERSNFAGDIELLAYCLMPNHFHLLIKQKSQDSISKFMKCLTTNYSMYFNKKYKRTGTLFQGRYKAVLIKDDNYLLHLSRYIHLNPEVESCKGLSLAGIEGYGYSSYLDYLGKRHTKWINPNLILEFFKTQQRDSLGDISSYQSFVEATDFDSEKVLGKLVLEF